MIDYMQEKVDRYCKNKKSRGEEFTLYNVYQMLKKDSCFWNLSAVLYGTWVNKTSDFEGVELSEQEW